LRAFLAQHRGEIRDLCVRKVQAQWPDRPGAELEADLATVIEEIVHALGREEGLPETSPLPGKSETAARHGRRRQELGYTIEVLARDFGAISESLGELAGREGLSFRAREYQVFNLCLDTLIGTAVEQYWNDARTKLEHATVERVGQLAHELRNALASARMAFSVLQRGGAGVDSRPGDVLARGLARLDGLIGQALLAVQLEAGVAVEPRRLRASALLRQVEESAVRERGVTVSVEADEALELDADELLLTSALSNLIQNAIKFTPRRRPRRHPRAPGRRRGRLRRRGRVRRPAGGEGGGALPTVRPARPGSPGPRPRPLGDPRGDREARRAPLGHEPPAEGLRLLHLAPRPCPTVICAASRTPTS
jgi:signal transduction histidine kinase